MPIVGTSHTLLIAPYVDLDSFGSHIVLIETYTSGAIAETLTGTWYHDTYATLQGDVVAIKGFVDTEISELITESDSLLDVTTQTYVNVGQDLDTYPPTTDVHDKLDALSTDIAALTGGGSEPETVIVLSTSDTTQIQSAVIIVRTIDQSTTKVDGLTTDVNGKLILELDADSFFIAATHNNYTQTSDTIVVAAGGQTDTLWMVQFAPGSASGALCRVYNNIKDVNQTAIRGAKITAEIPHEFWPVTHDNEARVMRYSTKSDTLGNWSMDILPNGILLTAQGDSSSFYIIEGKRGGESIFRYKVTVPDSSSFKMVPDSD
jgi:hypothetical protein